jgi:LysM repeat protein
MQPRMWRFAFVALFLAGLASLCLAAAAQAQEDTAHLVLRKKGTAKDRPSVYIVQKGDNLSTIVRRKLGKPASESASVSRLVRKLNPQIRNVDRIYPGQKIALPRLAAEPGKTGYVVRKGDSLSAILHERLGVPAAEMARWIGFVKKLNPGLVNADRIYPGQALILPDRGESTRGPVEQAAGPAETDAPQMDARAFRPTDRDLDIIATVVRRSGGTVVRDGKVFIPLTEEEHLAVDCADIPMVELADGSRIFLDYGRRIPADTAGLVRSRWATYSVISDGGTEGVFSALAGIFGASRDYTFRRHEGALAIGAAPVLKLQVDWILSRKGLDGQENTLLGVCRTSGRSEPIPEPVTRFAEKSGVPVLEIDEGSGAARVRHTPEAAPDVPSLDAGGNRAFVGSLLDTLGYTYAKDQRIPVSDSTQDGSPLAIRTDYSVRIGARTVVIHFGDLPAPFKVKLNEKGMGLVQIAGDDERKAVLEKVLKGLDIPYVPEKAEFSAPGDDRPPRWTLSLDVIRVTSEKGTLYLVPPEADRELCAFIRERWNRRLVRY